jgi:hypothetical protein
MCIRVLYPIMENVTSPPPASIRQRCLQSAKSAVYLRKRCLYIWIRALFTCLTYICIITHMHHLFTCVTYICIRTLYTCVTYICIITLYTCVKMLPLHNISQCIQMQGRRDNTFTTDGYIIWSSSHQKRRFIVAFSFLPRIRKWMFSSDARKMR